jgi:hypothetical protein
VVVALAQALPWANQSSIRPKRWVSNSRSSRSPRSAVSARRKRANSPCGNSTTWKN